MGAPYDRDPSKKIIIIISGFRGGRKGGVQGQVPHMEGKPKVKSGRAKTKEEQGRAPRGNKRERKWVGGWVGVQVFTVFCSRYTKWIGRLPPAHVGYT